MANYNRKLYETANLHYKIKFRWLNICVYCGQPATCLDHVMPISRVYSLQLHRDSVKRELFQGLNRVPSCSECNSIASKTPFKNIKNKRKFIQDRLREKHHKYLRTVEWENDEIEELGRGLKHEILKAKHNRLVMENRILFPAITKIRRIYGNAA